MNEFAGRTALQLFFGIWILTISCMNFSTVAMKLGSQFLNQGDYLNHIRSISHLPKGFSVGTTRFNFKPYEIDKQLPMNVTLIVADEPTDSFAAMFTSNRFPGGPIYIGKDRLKNSKHLQAVVINNKISNVCPGGSSDFGAGDSDRICEAVASKLKLKSKSLVFPSSTGIIGLCVWMNEFLVTRIDQVWTYQ